jgi:hypothetical protein
MKEEEADFVWRASSSKSAMHESKVQYAIFRARNSREGESILASISKMGNGLEVSHLDTITQEPEGEFSFSQELYSLATTQFVVEGDIGQSGGDDADSVRDVDYGNIVVNEFVTIWVYESARNDAYRVNGHSAKLRFYFTPPLTIDTKSVRQSQSQGEYVVQFTVLMTDPSLQRRVAALLKEREGITINESQVSLLPINRIRLTPRNRKYRDIRYVYPVGSSTGHGRPRFSQLHRVEFLFPNETLADALASDVKLGNLELDVDVRFSGKMITEDIFTIRMANAEKQQMFNRLNGGGTADFASRTQMLEALVEFLNKIDEYVYRESERRDSLAEEALTSLIRDSTLPFSPISISDYNEAIWQRMSAYRFDKNDIKPDKITKIVNDIKESSSYREANSKKIGASIQASFLGFGGSASGNYESQTEYERKMERAFRGEWEGERYKPKDLNINQIEQSNIRGESILNRVEAIVRPGEGRIEYQRRASDEFKLTTQPVILTYNQSSRSPYSGDPVRNTEINFGIGSEIAVYFYQLQATQFSKISILDSNDNSVIQYGTPIADIWSPRIPGSKLKILGPVTPQNWSWRISKVAIYLPIPG